MVQKARAVSKIVVMTVGRLKDPVDSLLASEERKAVERIDKIRTDWREVRLSFQWLEKKKSSFAQNTGRQDDRWSNVVSRKDADDPMFQDSRIFLYRMPSRSLFLASDRRDDDFRGAIEVMGELKAG